MTRVTPLAPRPCSYPSLSGVSFVKATLPRRVVRAFLATSMLVSCPTLVHAQTLPAPIPTRELIDENQVDLFRGVFVVDETVASVGGSQGLSYRRISRGNGFSSNFDSSLQYVGGKYVATVNGRSDGFTLSNGVYTSTEANGSSLSYDSTTLIYTYVARDGTMVTYDKNRRATGEAADVGIVASIVAPDGERTMFNHQVEHYCAQYVVNPNETETCVDRRTLRRLGSVENSAGFMFHITYASDVLQDGAEYDWTTVTNGRLINRAVDYCVAGTSCNYSQNWPGPDNPNHVINTYVESAGKITGVRRSGSASNDLTIGYDGNGRVSSVADHSGTTTYAYADSGNNRTVTVTNSLNQASTYVFDIGLERLTAFTNALNQTIAYQYDASGRVTRITKPEGNYTQFTYDARGNVTESRMVGKAGSGVPDIVATAAYPASCTNPVTCNSPTSTTDPRGNVTNYTYDGTHGGVLTITAPASTAGATAPQVRYIYVTQQAQVKNSSGALVGNGINVTLPSSTSQCQTLASCAGSADEVKSTVVYGPNLTPIQISKGNGAGTLTATTSIAYDPIGNVIAVDGPLFGTADTTTAIYDDKRRVIGTITADPDGAGARPRLAQRATYAANGDLTKVEVGTATGTSSTDLAAMTVAQAVDSTYDANGRKIRDTASAGGAAQSVVQYGYDSEGQLTCTALRMNPAAWGSLPGDACALGAQGSNGPDRITRMVRDATGRPTQVQVAYGVAGQQANEQTVAYNANGTTTYLIDANNNRTSYAYDGHDRLVKTSHPVTTTGGNSSSASDYEQLTLDANGNATQRRLRDGLLINYTYDALNRLIAKDLPGAEPDATYAYDLLGRMTSATQGGMTTTLGWDALSRRISEGSAQGTVSSQYDLAGRRTRVTLPGATTLWADYDFDVLGNVTAIRENGATSGVGVLASYAYDSLSRPTTVTFGNGTSQSYSYDAASRLASQTLDLPGTANDLTQGFTYNPASQIKSVARSNDAYAWTGAQALSRGYSVNGLNQYTAAGPASFTYDGRGNLTGDGSSTFTYKSENYLTSATVGGSSLSLEYDPVGRLHQITQGAATTRFGYDGLDLIAEYNASNVLARRYVHGVGTDNPIVWYEGSSSITRRFFGTDERGSILAVTDSSGVIVGSNAYDEYGIPKSDQAGLPVFGRFSYTGQAWLSELGMAYYKARMFSPTLGRFNQTDPISTEDSTNIYAYVENDPVNRRDPLGLFGTFCGFLSAPDGAWGWRCNPNTLLISPPNLFPVRVVIGGRTGPGRRNSSRNERQLMCDRVNFANRMLDLAENLDKGGDKVLKVAGGAAIAAVAASSTGIGAPGGGLLGTFATFAGSGGLLTKTVASGLGLAGNTVGALATGDRSAFQNTFMNGIISSATSGRGGVAGGLGESAVQGAATQPVPNRYKCSGK